MRTLNLGILAHVDAGKTTLTERLLYDAGAIDHIGSVDEGTTQTDYLALERERGITIRAAVASFALGDLGVNIVDTPGHPDFIAEVERALGVVDGAILVISAVEGVQPQTPLLMRALQRLRVPTLIFVNKIDRPGADDKGILQEISRRLTAAIVPLGSAYRLGTPDAYFIPASETDEWFRRLLTETLAERSDEILRKFVDDERGVPYGRLRAALAEQTRRGTVHPLVFGSALTGAGVRPLTDAVRALLPAAAATPGGPVSGRVFKVERDDSREKVGYVRLFSGTLMARDRLLYGRGIEGKVTAISVYAPGAVMRGASMSAGEIGKLWGLSKVQVGDDIGDPPATAVERHFPPPTLESVVVPRRPDEMGRLRSALAELAEQDPLINVRQDDARHEIRLSLYGDVQKEVIEATLAREYGVEVRFQETTTICVERPLASGEAGEVLRAKTHTNVTGASSPTSTNPYLATLALRVEPAPVDSGVELRLDVDVRLVPLYVYKTVDAFIEQMTGYVRAALGEGLFGWQVTDCVVTVSDCGYRAPGTTAADFRKLTPLVVSRALQLAGTQVCEPMSAVRLEFPTETLNALLSLLGRLGCRAQSPIARGDLCVLDALVPTARLPELRRQLPGVTSGEGVLDARSAGYQAVSKEPPRRSPTTRNRVIRDEH
ncbi:MAG: TetM/TetW/TetO/TetS family tetracycline resistance ribosomal protection protein [Chloroflexota bacterium]|nr:TetM/TetW/TetO/TetS family tetracycline resistance ribosomal protection protein [Chloroflexota bacterium]